MLLLYICHDITHKEREDILCIARRKVTAIDVTTWLSIISLGRHNKVPCSVSHTQKCGKFLSAWIVFKEKSEHT